jgi:hypothetical protein
MLQPLTAEPSIIQALLDALRALPGTHAEVATQESRASANDQIPDAEIILQIGEQRVRLQVDVKRVVYPRDVREVLWRVSVARLNATPQGDPTRIHLIAADAISPGARELLQAERVGYYDRGGSVYVPVPGAYIFVDKPPPKSLAKSIGSLFSGRRSQVLHALLLHPKENLSGHELAARAQVSPATVSQVLSELDRLDELLPARPSGKKGRPLREPGALLDQWAKYMALAKPPRFHRYFLPALRTEELNEAIASAFAEHRVEYAVSFEAAAQTYAPFLASVSQVKCRALKGKPLESALTALNARPVEEGASLSVIESDSRGELLFRESVANLWLASPIQVYLDLLRSEGRAKELAQHLRHERIRF